MWRPVVPLLEARRELICVDLPGFGDSPPLGDGCTPDPSRLAAAVVSLLAELGLDRGRAHLAGNSIGGWVALEAAAAGHAATVTALAPAGLWQRSLAPKPALGRTLARLAEPVLGIATRSALLRRVMFFSTMAHPERMPADQAAALVRAYVRAPGFAAVNRAMRAGRFARIAEIPAPVTLVWPERDRLLARPRITAAAVREVRLPGCGHVPMWDDPEAVASALLAGSRRAAR